MKEEILNKIIEEHKKRLKVCPFLQNNKYCTYKFKSDCKVRKPEKCPKYKQSLTKLKKANQVGCKRPQ